MAKRPTIDEVFAAVIQFQDECRRAVQVSNIATYPAAHRAARNNFKATLAAYGLAQHIEWPGDEGEEEEHAGHHHHVD